MEINQRDKKLSIYFTIPDFYIARLLATCESAPARVVCGKRRNLTFEWRLYKLIEGETKISSALYPRCRDCAGYSASDPCRLVKAHKLASEHPEVWHDIISRDSGGNLAASPNRRSRRSKARRTWGLTPGCYECDVQSIDQKWKENEESHSCVHSLPPPGRTRVGTGPVLPRHPRRLNAQNYEQHGVVISDQAPQKESKLYTRHGAWNSSSSCPTSF